MATRHVPGRGRAPALALAAALHLGLGAHLGASPGPPRPAPLESALRALSTLHLLRGLQLTRSQLRGLASLAAEANRLREGYRVDEGPALADLQQQAEQYRERLLAGEAADGLEDPLARRLYQARSDAQARANRFEADLAALERRAEAVLNPEQRRVVFAFTRCVIAPAYLADPERVGQAASGSAYVALVREVRALSEEAWQGQRAARVASFLEGVEAEVGPLAAGRREELASRGLAVLEEARRLEPIAFRLRLGELAGFLDPEEQERRHLRRARELDERLAGGAGAVADWLLSEEARRSYPGLEEALGRDLLPPEAPELARIPTCVPDAAGAPRHCSTGSLSQAPGPREGEP